MPLRPAGRYRQEKRDCVILCAKNRELCLEVDPETKKTRLGKRSDSAFQRCPSSARVPGAHGIVDTTFRMPVCTC